MAARHRTFQTDRTREAIRTTQLIKRLQKHIDGEGELSSTQVRGIEILLRKSLPDLQATELSGPDGGNVLTNLTLEFVRPKVTGTKTGITQSADGDTDS